MRKRIASAAIATVMVVALIVAGWQLGWLSLNGAQDAPADEAAFASWLESSPNSQSAFAAFESFLEQEGVADVVPIWQLTRVDYAQDPDCRTSPFLVPPRETWGSIVPALSLVEDKITPRIGRVEVISAYRSPDANRCSRGATQSKHLTFEALDLRAISKGSNADLFDELCAVWRASGSDSNMGLGAYFDATDLSYNQLGRFHIDASGYRTWGRSYSSDTSPCV